MLGVNARPVVGQGGRPGRRAAWPAPGSPPTWSRSPAPLGAVAGAVVLFGTGHLFWGTVRRHRLRPARPARRRAGPGPRRRLGVRRRARLRRRPGRRRGHLRRAGLVVLRAAATTGCWSLLALLCLVLGVLTSYVKARAEGVGLRLRRRHRRAHRAADPGARRHRARPGSASRTRCTSACGCCSPAARSPSASASLAVRRGPPPVARRCRRRPDAAAADRLADAGPARPARRPAHRRRLRRRLARRPDAARAGGPRGLRPRPGAGPPAARARAPGSCGPTCGSSPAAGCPTPRSPTLTRRGLRSYARYWQEAFRLPTLSSERIVADTEVRRPRAPGEGARRAGRGLVMVLPHSGNWDAAGVWFVDFLGGPFMTVAERLQAGVAVPPVPRLPRVPGLPGRAAHRRAAAQHRGAPRVAGRRRGHLPARRPEPRQRRRAGRLLRPDGDDARRRGAAGRPDRCRAAARPSASSPSAAGGWSFSPEVPVDGPGRLQGPGRRRRCRRSPTRSPTSIAAQPEDWHMLGRIWADVPARSRRRVAPDADRPGLPLPVGRPRRGPVPRPRPRRDAARPGPPRRGAHPRRARGVPRRRVRHLRRPHGADPVQRLDGQRPVRPGVGRPGAPLAAGRALRRRPRARAGAAVGVPAGLHDRQGPDRGHLPRRHHPVEVAGRAGARWCGRGWSGSAAGSRSRTSPAGCRSSTSAATR